MVRFQPMIVLMMIFLSQILLYHFEETKPGQNPVLLFPKLFFACVSSLFRLTSPIKHYYSNSSKKIRFFHQCFFLGVFLATINLMTFCDMREKEKKCFINNIPVGYMLDEKKR